MKGAKLMATPKNEAEWAIYHEMIAEAEKDPVFGKSEKKRIEMFKNDQKDKMSWAGYRELMRMFS